MLSSLILYHCLFESCLFKQSRWANSLAWVIGTFHTFQIDRCLNYSRIKNRQRIQKERENTSKNTRFSFSQPTQMGVTACYPAMLWDISAATISWPGCCVGGLLRHPQHTCAQQWLHFLAFLCTWRNCILPFTEANTYQQISWYFGVKSTVEHLDQNTHTEELIASEIVMEQK